jgi:hypothetical protein
MKTQICICPSLRTASFFLAHPCDKNIDQLSCVANVLPGFGAVLKETLPPLLHTQTDAASLPLHNASSDEPVHVSDSHHSLQRSRRKPYKKGTPIAAAIVHELRARQPLPPSAAASAGSSSARTPRQGRHTGSVSASAAIQGEVSRQAGLDSSHRKAAVLGTLDSSTLSYRHEQAQPKTSPHVSAAAIEGIANGVVPMPDALRWSGRGAPKRLEPRLNESIVSGASSVIISEVEELLAECGITAELMTDAGLGTEESKRLLCGLYVHSAGFLQQLADNFAELPHRQMLLRHVWNGFAQLLERAEVGDAGEVGYTSVLAARTREAVQIEQRLRDDLVRTTTYLQGELEGASKKVDKANKLRQDQQQRAEAAEALLSETVVQRDTFHNERDQVSEQLRQMSLDKERLERQLDAELKALVPLKAQAAALNGARIEAQSAQSLAKKREAELSSALQVKAQLTKALDAEETATKVAVTELAICDSALQTANGAYDKLASERDAIRVAAAEKQAELEEKIEMGERKMKVLDEKYKKLIEQAKTADASAGEERKAKLRAQGEVNALNLELEAVRAELEAEKQLAAHNLTLVTEAKRALQLAEDSQSGLIVERDAAKRDMLNAVTAKARAVEDLEEANNHSKRLISDLKNAREEAKIARNDLDKLTLKSFRDCEDIKSELQKVVVAREAAEAETEEAKEQVRHWEDRAEQLENDAQKHRLALVERESSHQEHLLAAQKHALTQQRGDQDKLKRVNAAQTEESKVLAYAYEEVMKFGVIIEDLRADVARLTQDNMAYAAEVAAYEEAMTCRFELRATVDQGRALSSVLSTLYEEVRDQLALQSDQQRAIDAAYAASSEVILGTDELSALCSDVLEPMVDEAAASHVEVPLLREQLLQTSLLRGETLSQLRMTQDAAEDERMKFRREMTAISKESAEQKEQAAFSSKLLTEQLEVATTELTEATEELSNWRSGNIRLANAKQWREQRAVHTPAAATRGVDSPGAASLARGGLDRGGLATRLGSPGNALHGASDRDDADS